MLDQAMISAPPVYAALITRVSGLLGSFGVWYLNRRTNSKVEETNERVDSIERELQVKITLPRLRVYQTLWSLTEQAAPFLALEVLENGLTQEKRLDLRRQLQQWYYQNGNGIFLSLKARNLLVEAKDLLKEENCEFTKIAKKFSDLRNQMKNDVGTYGTYLDEQGDPDFERERPV